MMTFWCKGKKGYCNSIGSCDDCEHVNNSGGIELNEEDVKDVFIAQWISVKDRLPEKDELVLCIGAKGGMFIGEIKFLDGETAHAYVPNARSCRYAKYWMPLPKAPKEGEENA